jgi:hypothetical protein
MVPLVFLVSGTPKTIIAPLTNLDLSKSQTAYVTAKTNAVDLILQPVTLLWEY